LWSAWKIQHHARIFLLTMNKKTKTMYVVQPGGFGSGAFLFSTYEYDQNSEHGGDEASAAIAQPVVARQTQENRSWTQSVIRLPEAFRRTVWQPLTRRVLNLGNAA
jgi:hypothetical protein